MAWPVSCGHHGQAGDIRGLALVGRHAERGVALEVLDRAESPRAAASATSLSVTSFCRSTKALPVRAARPATTASTAKRFVARRGSGAGRTHAKPSRRRGRRLPARAPSASAGSQREVPRGSTCQRHPRRRIGGQKAAPPSSDHRLCRQDGGQGRRRVPAAGNGEQVGGEASLARRHRVDTSTARSRQAADGVRSTSRQEDAVQPACRPRTSRVGDLGSRIDHGRDLDSGGDRGRRRYASHRRWS